MTEDFSVFQDLYTWVPFLTCLWESCRRILCVFQAFGEKQLVVVVVCNDGVLDVCPPCYTHCSIPGLCSHSQVIFGSGCSRLCSWAHSEGSFLLVLLDVEVSRNYIWNLQLLILFAIMYPSLLFISCPVFVRIFKKSNSWIILFSWAFDPCKSSFIKAAINHYFCFKVVKR